MPSIIPSYFIGQIEASSSSATQVFIDSDLQEIVKFRERYVSRNVHLQY
jgi:hypothetical protein